MSTLKKERMMLAEELLLLPAVRSFCFASV
jgi:hypothetical protein